MLEPPLRAALLTLLWVGAHSLRCNTRNGCCHFRRGSQNGIECDLSMRKKVIRVKDKTSSSYQVLHFRNGSYGVEVEHNALDGKQEVLLKDLDTAIFLGRSQTSTVPSPVGTSGNLTIDRVGKVELHPHALDGWRGNDSVVQITNVARCRVDGSALAATTVVRRLLLENITELVLAKGAIQATVDELTLRNVTVAECARGALAGRVGRLRLISAEVRTLRSGCLRVIPGAKELSLRHSRLGRVRADAITGAVDELTFLDCKVLVIATGGVQLNVSRLSLSQTDIGDLWPDSLWVNASRGLSVRDLRVSSRLHPGGLRGLRAAGDRGTGRRPALNITVLRVKRADPGSLEFDGNTTVNVRELTFDIHKECERGDHHPHSVYVQSAWQSAGSSGGCQSSIGDFFRPMFQCDFQRVLNETEGGPWNTDEQRNSCNREACTLPP
ncbi:uncharacterized protein LOC122391917 [Amphibalanus amphitrite]|uniref:uncharacterized protein LOC122391917 n=1 Tax=Amphibalanus amphitrite TaxID=1232801 RepID=UPI001C9132E2|nr:uncharacterized protein LOC122391917 [Amphibalanus amphitrite]